MNPIYHLAIDGDDCGTTTLGSFLDLNHESNGGTLDAATIDAILALDVGAHYTDGGGAAPEWTLTRTR